MLGPHGHPNACSSLGLLMASFKLGLNFLQMKQGRLLLPWEHPDQACSWAGAESPVSASACLGVKLL